MTIPGIGPSIRKPFGLPANKRLNAQVSGKRFIRTG
jgi:hypothetical protein